MGRGITTFTLPLTKSAEEANQIIQHFLQINNFKLEKDSIGSYYHFYDPILSGHKGFSYAIYEYHIVINAWTGKHGKEYELTGMTGFAVNAQYLELLKSLEIALTGQPGVIANTQTNFANNKNQNPTIQQVTSNNQQYQIENKDKGPNDQTMNVMENTLNAQKEKLCIAAFIMSLVTEITSLFGIVYGVPLLIFEYFGAIKGLKTKKKGFAITTLVLASISTVILLLYLIVSIMSI